MGGVDPGAVHAGVDEAGGQLAAVVGCGGGERHHDPHRARRWERAEERGGVRVQAGRAVVEGAGVDRGQGLAGQGGAGAQGGADRRADVRLAPPEGGDAEAGELRLQVPQFVVAQGEVVGEVGRPVAVRVVDGGGAGDVGPPLDVGEQVAQGTCGGFWLGGHTRRDCTAEVNVRLPAGDL